MPTQPSQIDPAAYVLHRARPHLPLIATVAACATFVVASDAPSRLDLWTAEWFGTMVVLAAPPAILMRWFGIRDSVPMLILTLVLALGLVQARDAGRGADDAARKPAVQPPATQSKSLPTASDGFGAYTKTPDTSRSS